VTLEIHRPELEALIHERMASGAFRDLDELLTKALGALKEQGAPDVKKRSFVELFRPVRGLLTDEEIDWLFSRNRSAARPLDLA